MNSHQLKFPKTHYYYTKGTLDQNTAKIYIVLHGYGQLASQIIHKFEAMDEQTFVIAPEGNSRFYWNEAKAIVGASWMTKKDRLHEIEDYCNFISMLYEEHLNSIKHRPKIILLGFSQGGATAIRWIYNCKPQINHLILWGAGFPMDLDYQKDLNYFNEINIHLVQGRKDPYLSKEMIEKHKAFTKNQALDFKEIWFDGKHEIDRDILHKIDLEID